MRPFFSFPRSPVDFTAQVGETAGDSEESWALLWAVLRHNWCLNV